MLWKRNITSFQVQRLVRSRQQKTPKIDATQGNVKEQVSNTVRSVLKHYSFCSLGELNAILSRYNLAVEEVKTEV